jgi:hypothetical protein
MRAYRTCAAFARASTRPQTHLRFLLIAPALAAGLCVPLLVSFALGATQERPQTATQPACFGILGEVARPGVYQLPAHCTFGQLVQYAGGVTCDANGNARVFRGARVAQQLFVASSASETLYPGDLIVIERSAMTAATSHARPRYAAGGSMASRAAVPRAAEVQIGFLNLIDRPVVVKMLREQASPARIGELLRQPAELIENVRIVGPSG